MQTSMTLADFAKNEHFFHHRCQVIFWETVFDGDEKYAVPDGATVYWDSNVAAAVLRSNAEHYDNHKKLPVWRRPTTYHEYSCFVPARFEYLFVERRLFLPMNRLADVELFWEERLMSVPYRSIETSDGKFVVLSPTDSVIAVCEDSGSAYRSATALNDLRKKVIVARNSKR